MTQNDKKTPNWQEKMGKKPQDDEKMQENEGKIAEDAKNDENLSEVEILEQKLAKSEEKANELNNKLLRALAEIENIRRRSREELEKTSNYAISNFVSELVVVAENFFLACDNLPKSEDGQVKGFIDGVLMTKNELMKILEKNKVKRIYPLGEKFDHNFHEAMSRVESEEEENVVVQVVQAGYLIGDRLIRPALVSVSS